MPRYKRGRKPVKKVYKGIEFDSGFEVRVAQQLDSLGVTWEFEPIKLDWLRPIRKGKCTECGSKVIAQECIYTPDFWLPDLGFFIEAKGIWPSSNRTLHRELIKQHPDVDIKFTFEMDQWQVKTTKKKKYSDWCITHKRDYWVYVPESKQKNRKAQYINPEWFVTGY